MRKYDELKFQIAYKDSFDIILIHDELLCELFQIAYKDSFDIMRGL